MKIYVASSWRNVYHQDVVRELRNEDFDVYDFRNPELDNHGFHWSEIDPRWKSWTPQEFRCGLTHEIAIDGFGKDWNAMCESDACVLVLPCGRSAHLEAGCFIGWKRPVFIYMPEQCEPELMYKASDRVCVSMTEIIASLKCLSPTFH